MTAPCRALCDDRGVHAPRPLRTAIATLPEVLAPSCDARRRSSDRSSPKELARVQRNGPLGLGRSQPALRERRRPSRPERPSTGRWSPRRLAADRDAPTDRLPAPRRSGDPSRGPRFARRLRTAATGRWIELETPSTGFLQSSEGRALPRNACSSHVTDFYRSVPPPITVRHGWLRAA